MSPRIGGNAQTPPAQRTQTTPQTAPNRARPQPPRAEPQRTAPRQDGFEVRRNAPVALQNRETPKEERDRRVRDLHSILEKVKNANPPLTEVQLGKLLGTADDGRYEGLSNQVDKNTRDGLYSLAMGIHQLGRARYELAQGNKDMARAYLDIDPSDTYTGVTSFRDKATSLGLTPQEVGPLALANVDVLQKSFGALSVDQEKLNADSVNSYGLGKEITTYFESKNEVMSQGGYIQGVLRDVRGNTDQLNKALAMPLTDPNRDKEVRAAKANLDANIQTLRNNVGDDIITNLDKNRKAVPDGLNMIGDVLGSVPTPITRAGGAVFKTAANGLQYASGDITGKQFLLNEAATIIDAAGGQFTQRLRGVTKFVADAGAEFTKTLAGELAKIDPKLPPGEQARLAEDAAKAALLSTITAAYTDAIGGTFGDAGQTVIKELARASLTGLTGAVGTYANEIRKTMYRQDLTPDQKAAQIREGLWKAVQNVVKSTTEAVITSSRRI